jgi:hypothetical protein
MPDELDDYLNGTSRLSRQYRRECSPAPPHALDRRVLKAARQAQPKSQFLAPLAFAASVFLSVALVLAIVFAPQSPGKFDDAPQVMKVRNYHAEAAAAAARTVADARERTPDQWLSSIDALRRAGRIDEADAEMRLFRRIYPDYPISLAK